MPIVGVQYPVDHRALELGLTRWLHHRVRETAPPSSPVQLFGLEVIDPDGIDALEPLSVRTVFVCDGQDTRAVLGHPDAWRAFDFDAVALVRHGWSVVPTASVRPGVAPRRQRGVVVDVVARP